MSAPTKQRHPDWASLVWAMSFGAVMGSAHFAIWLILVIITATSFIASLVADLAKWQSRRRALRKSERAS